jgi:hypothetical protein
MGTFGSFQVFPNTTRETIQVAEQRLGFLLPWFLRELYLKVGNGGFGPGYGIFGLTNGAPAIANDGTYHDLVSFYYIYRGDKVLPHISHDFTTKRSLFLETMEQWFDQLVPIFAWGCHHYSLLGCSKSEVPVIHYIGYGGELILEATSLEAWLVVVEWGRFVVESQSRMIFNIG